MQVQIYGITQEDIQAIFEKVITENRSRLCYLDVSYLYTFDLNDFETIRKINLLTRYSLRAVKEWHKILERWLSDQTVVLGCRQIKPIKISRSFDRVVNEGMEETAMCWMGSSGSVFKFHAIGDGAVSEALPSDKAMVNQLSRIDVTTGSDGGSVTRDGSTFYIIGNHPKTTEQGNMSETGVFNSEDTSIDKMLDHSVFADEVEHLINQDIPGSTTVIWQCSA
jgi:hypothetical protein